MFYEKCSRDNVYYNIVINERTKYKKHDIFDFDITLKTYLRCISSGDIVDADPPPNAVVVSPEHFVKFVVKYLDESF